VTIKDLPGQALAQVKGFATWLWSGRGLLAVALVLALWWAGVFGWFYFQDTATTSDCTNTTKDVVADGAVADEAVTTEDEAEVVEDDEAAPDEPTVGAGAEDVAGTSGQLVVPDSFDFTTRRDAQTHVIPITVPGELPADIEQAEIVIEGFDGPGGAPAIGAVHSLHDVGSGLVLEICIDSQPLTVDDDTVSREETGFTDWLRGTTNTRPGTYTTNVHIIHDDVTIEPIPIQVRFQGRYLWLLAPLVMVMPALAIAIVYGLKPPVRWPLVYVSTLGTTAVAFNAQALSDPDWGGIVACFGLVGATFTSAITTATIAAKTPTSG
jgi:hypothetical protein